MSEIRRFPPGSKGVDMSGDAVLKRLMMVGELNELCWFLGSSDLAKKAAEQAGRAWRTPWLPVASEYHDGQPTGE